MREIKFRTFDKETEDKHMIYSDGRDYKYRSSVYDFVLNKDGKLVCAWQEDYDDSCGFPAENRGDLDNLMQFTGLLDKNGKEIYEGDVVRCRDTYCEVQEFTGVVDFADASFRIRDDAFTHYRWQDYEVEVIGNIYENPELLEQQP